KDNETIFLYVIKPSAVLKFYSEEVTLNPEAGDTIVSLTPPDKEIRDKQAIKNGNGEKQNRSEIEKGRLLMEAPFFRGVPGMGYNLVVEVQYRLGSRNS